MNETERYFRSRDQRTQDTSYLKISRRLSNGQYESTKLGSGAKVIASKANPGDEFVPGTIVVATYLGASKATIGGQWVIISRAPQEQKGASANPPSISEEEFSSATVSSWDPAPVELTQDGPAVVLTIFGTGFTTAPLLPVGILNDIPPVITLTQITLHLKATMASTLGPGDIQIAPGVMATGALDVLPSTRIDPNIFVNQTDDDTGVFIRKTIETVGWTVTATGVSRDAMTNNIPSGAVEYGGELYDFKAMFAGAAFARGVIERFRMSDLALLATSQVIIKAGTRAPASPGLMSYGILAVRESKIWVAGMNDALTEIHLSEVTPGFATGAAVFVDHFVVAGLTASSVPVSIMIDDDGVHIWVATYSNGLYRYNTGTGVVDHVVTGQVVGSLSQDSNYVYCCRDAANDIGRIDKTTLAVTSSGALYGGAAYIPMCAIVRDGYVYIAQDTTAYPAPQAVSRMTTASFGTGVYDHLITLNDDYYLSYDWARGRQGTDLILTGWGILSVKADLSGFTQYLMGTVALPNANAGLPGFPDIFRLESPSVLY